MTPLLPFGASRFLQAHADLFVSAAGAGPITVVQTTGTPSSRARVAGFRALRPYPVQLRGIVGGGPWIAWSSRQRRGRAPCRRGLGRGDAPLHRRPLALRVAPGHEAPFLRATMKA